MKLTICAIVYFAMLASASAQYQGWKNSGSLYILTTPEGANLPATAAEENFPLLVRLNKDWLDFGQAKPNGDDIRFSSADGNPLVYQIEEWDAAKGTASIWVRIPVVKGNARQEIKVYWGKPDAAGESSGPSVFNSTNGYCCVMHMNGDVVDSTGSIAPVNNGATQTTAVIGSTAWNLGSGSINAANITNFPAGNNPSSTSEIWLRVRRITSWSMPLAWGNKNAYGWNTWKMQIGFWGSPTVLPSPVTCRGPGAVSGATALEAQQWYHVVYTASNGTGKIYVNGTLDATASGGSMSITNPQALCLAVLWGGGGAADVDEARISSVVRSADWVRMEYENQKPLPTMVGPLVQAGSDFSISAKQITLLEGKSATVTAKAGAADRLYWVIRKDGHDTIVDTNKFNFTLDAGRVKGDQSFTLRCVAVYANGVKTQDIPVTIREAIPEPVFALQAPSNWNGRDTIEVVTRMSNLQAMTANGVGELHCQWSVTGGAVTQEIAPGKLILKRSQYTGPILVKAQISNGGPATVATAPIQVAEPKNDPWVERTPGKDEIPEDGQFYARDDNNEGTLYYNGILATAADSVFLKIHANDKLIKTEVAKPSADNSYCLTAKLKAGLIQYKVEFGTKTGDTETVERTVGNLVCGDAYLIAGQSNALATDTGEKSPAETSEWIRSYGGPTGRGDATGWVRDQFDKVREATGQRPNLWCNAVWKRQKDEKAALGWWGMELAKNLLASRKMPICIIQAAVGGTRIDEHKPNATDHLDLKTYYGHMLWRLINARLTHGIRAVLWHQGEADQGSDGPDNGYDSAFYQQYFMDMTAAWKQDMPNIRHYYVFQIWPNGCGQGAGHGDLLREKQRTLPRLYSNLDVMSTLGIKPPGACHYPLDGWSQFARLMQPLIERDFYGRKVPEPITAPDLIQVYYASAAKDAIILEFDQPVIWLDSLAGQFYLDDAKDRVAKGSVNGNVITLQLKAPATAGKITYIKEKNWNQNDLVFGKNGIAALTFCDVPILPEKPFSK